MPISFLKKNLPFTQKPVSLSWWFPAGLQTTLVLMSSGSTRFIQQDFFFKTYNYICVFLIHNNNMLFKEMGISLVLSTIYNKHLINSCKLFEQKGFLTECNLLHTGLVTYMIDHKRQVVMFLLYGYRHKCNKFYLCVNSLLPPALLIFIILVMSPQKD